MSRSYSIYWTVGRLGTVHQKQREQYVFRLTHFLKVLSASTLLNRRDTGITSLLTGSAVLQWMGALNKPYHLHREGCLPAF